MKGKHKGIRGFNLYDAEKLELRAAVPMVLHADGEYMGDVKLITMEVLRSKLRVLI
jgi:diacylglycerol kinase family enzyme